MTKPTQDMHATAATIIWQKLDDTAKVGIRFGMFPFALMKNAEREGYDSKLLCVALMDCAERDGGMRA